VRALLRAAATLLILSYCSATSAAPQWPVQGAVLAGFNKHGGIDIAAASGSTVHAYGAGTVTTTDVVKHCGRRVKLKHADDSVTVYCNLDAVQVKPGDVVTEGQALGTVAPPPPGRKAHLHFELHIGDKRVDPLTHLPTPVS
jgi:murein DD-endopeptidase MepM/ murein hydrolase activator NlpD